MGMVGYGIKDSPTLVETNVEMEIGAGINFAFESRDIVLMKRNIKDVITAVDVSKKTLFSIHVNYVWALGYNVFGIPIAAGILFPVTSICSPPWLAGACMVASSLKVVCSSLLLESQKRPN